MTDASFAAADMLSKSNSTRTKNLIRFANHMLRQHVAQSMCPSPDQDVNLCKRLLKDNFTFNEFGHIFWGAPKPVSILTDIKAKLYPVPCGVLVTMSFDSTSS